MTTFTPALIAALELNSIFIKLRKIVGLQDIPCPKHTPVAGGICVFECAYTRTLIAAGVALLVEAKIKPSQEHPGLMAAELSMAIKRGVPTEKQWQYEEILRHMKELATSYPPVEVHLHNLQRALYERVTENSTYQAARYIVFARLSPVTALRSLTALTTHTHDVYQIIYKAPAALLRALGNGPVPVSEAKMAVPSLSYIKVAHAKDPAVAQYIAQPGRALVIMGYVLPLSQMDPRVSDIVICYPAQVVNLASSNLVGDSHGPSHETMNYNKHNS